MEQIVDIITSFSNAQIWIKFASHGWTLSIPRFSSHLLRQIRNTLTEGHLTIVITVSITDDLFDKKVLFRWRSIGKRELCVKKKWQDDIWYMPAVCYRCNLRIIGRMTTKQYRVSFSAA